MSSNLDIQTRPATLRDAKAIAEIHVNTWQVAYADLVPDDVLKAMSVEKQQAMWREAIQYSEPQVVVALDGNAHRGLCRGLTAHATPKPNRPMVKSGPCTSLPIIGMKAWAWPCGTPAAKVWWTKGCLDVSLWVLLRNERAMRFYDLAGFKREMNTAKTVPMGSGKVEEIRLKRSLS